MIRLKELREEHGMDMKEAAKFLNKKYMTYVNHEKGEREPNSEDLRAYADAYHVSIDYLVGRSDEKNPVMINDGSNERIIDKSSSLYKLSEMVPDLTEDQADSLLPLVIKLVSGQKTQDSQK